jgi:hypothetical protein
VCSFSRLCTHTGPRSSGYLSCFVFGGARIHISVRKSSILAQFFVFFQSPFRKNTKILSKYQKYQKYQNTLKIPKIPKYSQNTKNTKILSKYQKYQNTLKLRHSRFLLYPFHFFIHLQSYNSRLYSLSYELQTSFDYILETYWTFRWLFSQHTRPWFES